MNQASYEKHMQTYNLPQQQEKRILPSSIGRTVGILLLLQLVAALTLPFILSKPITFGSPAFLAAVTAHAFQIRFAVLLSFIGAGLTVYLGVTAFQVFKLYNFSVALLFVVVCGISCTLDVTQAGTIMSMLSISNEFVTSGSANPEIYRIIGGAVASARRSAHIMQLVAIAAWMYVFYISLLRFKLIPQLLSLIGVVGVTLQFVGVTLMMLLGHRAIGQMAMPLLPIQITVGVWLIVKGFSANMAKAPVVSDIGQSL